MWDVSSTPIKLLRHSTRLLFAACYVHAVCYNQEIMNIERDAYKSKVPSPQKWYPRKDAQRDTLYTHT